MADTDDDTEDESAGLARVARELIDRAGVKLHQAADTHISGFAIDCAADAADYLNAAGKLLDGELKFTLLRLSALIRQAVKAAFGNPNEQTLDAVADEVRRMAETISGER